MYNFSEFREIQHYTCQGTFRGICIQVYLIQVNLQKLLYDAADYLSTVSKHVLLSPELFFMSAANYQPGPFRYYRTGPFRDYL